MSDIQEEIEKLEKKKKTLKEEIRNLQNENGLKLELLAKNQEKLNALNAELSEKTQEYNELEKRLASQVGESKNKYSTESEIKTDAKNSVIDNKINEKFNSLLEEISTKIETRLQKKQQKIIRRQIKEDGETEQSSYKKPTTSTVCVKYVKDTKKSDGDYNASTKEKVEYHVTFRIDETTDFKKLLEEACRFWGLEREDHEFFDENMNTIATGKSQKAQNVDKYFSTKTDYSQVLVILKKKEPENPNAESDLKNKKKKKNDDIKKSDGNFFQEFYKRFPGMRSYIYLDEEEVEERKEILKKFYDPKTFDENHCCVFTIFSALLLLTLFAIVGERDITYTYYSIAGYQQSLYIDSSYSSIISKSDFQSYLVKPISELFFLPNNSSTTSTTNSGGNTEEVISGEEEESVSNLQSNSVFIGPLRLRQVRIQSTQCKRNIISTNGSPVKCYYDYYDTDTRYTEDFGKEGWQIFLTVDETGITSTINGVSGTYDGAGYIYDFDVSTYDTSQFVAIMQGLQANDYYDQSVKAIFLTSNLYNVAGEFFVIIELGIEFTSVGIVAPLTPYIKTFIPNLYQSSKVPHYTLDVLKGLLAALVAIFIIYNLICGSSKISIDYLKTFQGILNIFCVVFIFWGIALNSQLAGYGASVDSLLQTTKYIDLKPIADKYEESFIIQSLAFFVVLVRLATVLTKNSRVYLIIKTFETTGARLISYFFIYAPIIIAFSIIGMYIWGPTWGDYSTFYRAIITTLMFTVGQVQASIIQDQAQNIAVVTIYTVVFYFFVISFFSIVFRGILIEGYRIMMLDYGHSFHDKTWIWKDYVKWFFSWVPLKIVSFMEKKAKMVEKKWLNRKKKTNQQ